MVGGIVVAFFRLGSFFFFSSVEFIKANFFGNGGFWGDFPFGIYSLFGLLVDSFLEKEMSLKPAQNWRLGPIRLRLIGEECERCGERIFPPRDLCPACREKTLPEGKNLGEGRTPPPKISYGKEREF